MGWTVFPLNSCVGLLTLWPCLERGPLQLSIRMSHTGVEWSLTQYDGGPMKRGHLDREQTCTQGDCHENTQGDTGVMHLQAKECQRLPANHQKLGERHGTDSPHGPGKELTMSTPSLWTSSLQNCETIQLSFKGTLFCDNFCYTVLASKYMEELLGQPNFGALSDGATCRLWLVYWVVKVLNITLIAESSFGQYSPGDSRLLISI